MVFVFVICDQASGTLFNGSTFDPYAGLFVLIVAPLFLGAYLKAGHVHHQSCHVGSYCHSCVKHVQHLSILSQSSPLLLLPSSCLVPFVVVTSIVVPLFLELICSLTMSTSCDKSCHAGSYNHGRAKHAQQYSLVSPPLLVVSLL